VRRTGIVRPGAIHRDGPAVARAGCARHPAGGRERAARTSGRAVPRFSYSISPGLPSGSRQQCEDSYSCKRQYVAVMCGQVCTCALACETRPRRFSPLLAVAQCHVPGMCPGYAGGLPRASGPGLWTCPRRPARVSGTSRAHARPRDESRRSHSDGHGMARGVSKIIWSGSRGACLQNTPW
jgi:hypothetical protein